MVNVEARWWMASPGYNIFYADFFFISGLSSIPTEKEGTRGANRIKKAICGRALLWPSPWHLPFLPPCCCGGVTTIPLKQEAVPLKEEEELLALSLGSHLEEAKKRYDDIIPTRVSNPA